MSELDDNLAAGIAAKHTPMCERDGGGYHYDSCVRCRLRDDIKEAFRVVREDEREKLRDTGIERAITHPECW